MFNFIKKLFNKKDVIEIEVREKKYYSILRIWYHGTEINIPTSIDKNNNIKDALKEPYKEFCHWYESGKSPKYRIETSENIIYLERDKIDRILIYLHEN